MSPIQAPAGSVPFPALAGEEVLARWDGVELVLVTRNSPAASRQLAEEVARRAMRDTPFHTPAYVARETEDARVYIARQDGAAVGLVVLQPRPRWAWWGWDDWDAERRPSTGVAPMISWTVETIWTHPNTQNRGLARRLLEAASVQVGQPIPSFAWHRPFTPSGEALVRRHCPEGFWVPE